MTNSYSLSPKIKVVFFHGLNNSAGSFLPLMNHFNDLGHETEFIRLPGHGPNRNETKDFTEAHALFEKSMEKLKDKPYVALAFSQGALYLQIWLKKRHNYHPLKQVLLAPALYIKRQRFNETLIRILPSTLAIKSFAPEELRNFSSLFIWEYRLLIDSILHYQTDPESFYIPTLIVIDPLDELVDALKLKNEIEKINSEQNVEFIKRKKIKSAAGLHHILFHPDYFEKEAWDHFTRKLSNFLVNS